MALLTSPPFDISGYYNIRLSGSLDSARTVTETDPSKGEGFGSNLVLSFKSLFSNGKPKDASDASALSPNPTL